MCDLNTHFKPYIIKLGLFAYRFIIFGIQKLGTNKKNIK